MGQGRYEMQKNNDNKDILIWDNKTDECLCCIAQIEAKLNLQDYIIKDQEQKIAKLVEENQDLRTKLDTFKPVVFQDIEKGTIILYSKGDSDA